jgi:type 1 glutamine amidotransferase
MQRRIFLLFSWLLLHAIAHAQKAPAKPITVLIIDGFSNHDWKQTSNLTKRILEETKRFKVSISTAPPTMDDPAWASWNPRFEAYDVVIQNTNNIKDTTLRWPRRIEEQLEKYVSKGGGLYILHSANNAFPHWKEYDRMIGLGWRSRETGFALEIDTNNNILRIPPGEGKSTNHGDRFDAVIRILKRHPINKDLPEQWKTSSMELYRYARGPAENITLLSCAYDSISNKTWPVEWVVNYGKGNVYNSSMGHLWKGETYPNTYRCIGFQTTMIRVAEWLATGKVTYPVPANFPTKDAVSVRAESDHP